MKSILVSACLLGVNCKYSGGNNRCAAVEALREKYALVPVCPEQLGGLPTPRPPAERQGDAVLNNQGADVTPQYRKGAGEALRMAKLFGCDTAVLKSRSPSCGCGEIYDGSFQSVRVPGDGVTTELLKAWDIRVFTEENFSEEL